MAPLVGVSPCLLGRLVRYDGGHKRDDAVLGLRARWFELCPEAAAGLGTPREPARLIGTGSRGGRFVGVHSAQDVTEALVAFIETAVVGLPWNELAGWVLKARSPSCGLGTTPRFADGAAKDPAALGDGLWAEALRARDPQLPLIDEAGLANVDRRQAWWEAVQERAVALSARSGP